MKKEYSGILVKIILMKNDILMYSNEPFGDGDVYIGDVEIGEFYNQ